MISFKRAIPSIFIIFSILFTLTACNSMKNTAYGTPTTFSKNTVIEFPDFSLTYLGERKEVVDAYVHGYFTYDDFEIRSGSQSETITWTTGTGEIGPIPFEFNGKDYYLEKGLSDLVRLKSDQIVIWKAETFDQWYAQKREEMNALYGS